MVVSAEFNALYHGAFLGDLYKQMLAKKAIIMTFDKFKQALKYSNDSYPRYTGTDDLVSTAQLSNKDLLDHIEWITRWSSEYGLSLNIHDEEWDRLMAKAHA